ncbi:MAG: GNAT family N-acetyltransferase [Clostridia bacterium]|nr:GNAT family N-acetyltransferase [Clostridia bacterium]
MYTIRKYVPSDKEQLRFICKETTWDDNKKSENKLETIPIIFNDYFTENEPDNIFVAVNDDNAAVGYVICSTDYSLFRKKMTGELRKRVEKTYPSSLFMLWATYFSVAIAKKPYRTHLHIDILPEAQRMGLGTKLIDALCAHLKAKGIKNVSVVTINKNSMGYKFYCKYGFRTVHRYSKDIITMTYDIK